MSDEKKTLPYLTPRFKPGLYNWDMFIGPRAGEPAIDFTAVDLEGNEVKLSDFRGRWVVLETGSATCSQYSKNIARVGNLRAAFPDVEFLVVYVREAHPGERLHQHRSFEEKKRAAALLPRKYKEHRRILIDSLDGQMHRAYGGMPNVVYVINPDGIVHYRCDWTHVEGLRKALTERDHIHPHEHADMKEINAQRSPWIAIRTMWTGGIIALWDFVRALPTIVKKHKLVDAFYARYGRFRSRPDETLEELEREREERKTAA
ncbi:MAG: peroxiredoxin family protein [Rhodothalassiaceae bacterium]